ncbi:hypothetical protein SprV_0802511800 [Sparganum proliferum]
MKPNSSTESEYSNVTEPLVLLSSLETFERVASEQTKRAVRHRRSLSLRKFSCCRSLSLLWDLPSTSVNGD